MVYVGDNHMLYRPKLNIVFIPKLKERVFMSLANSGPTALNIQIHCL